MSRGVDDRESRGTTLWQRHLLSRAWSERRTSRSLASVSGVRTLGYSSINATTIGNLLTGQALANERKDLGFPRRFCFRNARAARRPLPSGSARSRSRRSAAAERLMIAIHSRSQSHTTEELGVALPPVLHDRSKTIRAGGHRLPVPRITGCSWDTHERVAFPPRPNPPRGCSPDGPARCRDRVDAAAGPPA